MWLCGRWPIGFRVSSSNPSPCHKTIERRLLTGCAVSNDAGDSKFRGGVPVVHFGRYCSGLGICRRETRLTASVDLCCVVEYDRFAGAADRRLGDSVAGYPLDVWTKFDCYDHTVGKD